MRSLGAILCVSAIFLLDVVRAPEARGAPEESAPIPEDDTTGGDTTEDNIPEDDITVDGPLPPRPSEKRSPEKRSPESRTRPAPSAVTPGFERSSEEADDARSRPPRAKASNGSGKRAKNGEPLETEDEALRRPVDIPPRGPNERLIEDLNQALGEVSLAELIDEILGDVVAEIDARPAKWMSPMAIRQVALGANVVPSFSRKLKSTITAQVHAGTEVRIVDCLECEATRTRLEDGQWVVTRGIVDSAEMKRVAETIGAKSFMDVAFGFDPATGVLEMDFRIIRASDAFVVWADSFRADETTPILARSSEAPIKRKDRLRDLEMLLEGRPFYGMMTSAGFMLLPHDDPVDGDIGGATAGYRIYERFGRDRRIMFGLDLMGFINTARLAGAVVSAGSWWIPFRPDFVHPELRLGAKAGAFIAGTAGNAAVFQLGAEVLLRYRFGLFAYALIMTRSEFPPDSGTSLGGVGLSTGMSFNW